MAARRRRMASWGGRGSVRATASPFRGLNQGAEGRIHCFLVGKVRRDIRRKQHQIRSCSITRVILASDSAFQLRQVVFRPQTVTSLPFLSLFLHIVFVRAAFTVSLYALPLCETKAASSGRTPKEAGLKPGLYKGRNAESGRSSAGPLQEAWEKADPSLRSG